MFVDCGDSFILKLYTSKSSKLLTILKYIKDNNKTTVNIKVLKTSTLNRFLCTSETCSFI